MPACVCVRARKLEQGVKRGARGRDGGDRKEGSKEKGGSEGVSEQGRGRRSGCNTKTSERRNRKELLAARASGERGEGGEKKVGTELLIEEDTKREWEKD